MKRAIAPVPAQTRDAFAKPLRPAKLDTWHCTQCGGFEPLLDTRGPECGLCDGCSELWKLCDGCNTYKPSEDGDFEREGEALTDSTWLCRECADAEHAARERDEEQYDGPVSVVEGWK